MVGHIGTMGAAIGFGNDTDLFSKVHFIALSVENTNPTTYFCYK